MTLHPVASRGGRRGRGASAPGPGPVMGARAKLYLFSFIDRAVADPGGVGGDRGDHPPPLNLCRY